MKRTITIPFMFATIALSAASLFAGNPFIWWDGNADPSICIFNGTAYLFPSHDSSEYVTTWLENNFKCYSSTDLVNWTDNGVILDNSKISWASAASHSCWAPDCHFYNGAYYFYFSIGGNVSKIGVARSTAATPTTGFSDWAGASIASSIDPSCFTDDDGSKYLTWGQPGSALGFGTNCFGHAKLNADMKSFTASPVGLCIPSGSSVTEASFIVKRNGIYYLFYGTTSNGVIRYGTSTTLAGPYTFKGGAISGYKYCQGTGHGSVFQLNGQWYIASHMCIYSNAYFRKTGIWYLHFKDNGDIDSITAPGTWGVGRYKAFDTMQAENYFAMQGVTQKQCSEGGYALFGIHDGSWGEFPNTNFLNCRNGLGFQARIASTRGGTIEVRQGGSAGTLLGSATVPNTGGLTSWQTVSAALSVTPGTYQNDIYFTFKGTAGDTAELFACNWFRFTTTDPLPRNAFDEIQTENFDSSAAVTTAANGVITGSGSITATANAAYVLFNNVYFGNGASAIDIRYRSGSKAATRSIELRVDSRTGPVLGTVPITDTTNTWRAKFYAVSSTVTGLHNLYLNFLGTSGATGLFDIDMIRFIEAPPQQSGINAPKGRSFNGVHATSSERYTLQCSASGRNGMLGTRGNAVPAAIYTLSGRKVAELRSDNKMQTGLPRLKPGVYIVLNKK